MVKLCIRTEDKINPDWFKNIGCMKRGHVVEVLRDDQTGGVRDIARTDLKIVQVDMSQAEAVALMAGEPGDVRITRTLRRRRMFRLDIDNLVSGDKTQFDDKASMTKEGRLTVTQIRAVKVESKVPVDPNVVA